MIKELTSRQLAYRARMKLRTTGDNGRPFAPLAPSHGSSSAVTYWGCRCDPCGDWIKDMGKAAYSRRKHNRLILMTLKNGGPTGSGPSGPGEVAEDVLPDAEDSPAPAEEEPAAAHLGPFHIEFLKQYEERYRKTS